MTGANYHTEMADGPSPMVKQECPSNLYSGLGKGAGIRPGEVYTSTSTRAPQKSPQGVSHVVAEGVQAIPCQGHAPSANYFSLDERVHLRLRNFGRTVVTAPALDTDARPTV